MRKPSFLGEGAVAGLAFFAASGYTTLVAGAVPIDVGVGRRIRPRSPQIVQVATPQELATIKTEAELRTARSNSVTSGSSAKDP